MTGVKSRGQHVWHWLEGELPTVGADRPGIWTGTAGTALMRTHTALHTLCGVVWRDYRAQVTGGNMEPGCGPDGLRVRDDVGGARRHDRGRA